MFESNSIIRASAGTGKTFALATRFIRLMMLDRVEPATIVALTFSRAAAQEIYTKILDRLCNAAVNESGAEREWDNLLADYRNDLVPNGAEKLAAILANPPPHSATDFSALLRRLVDTQHLGAIATLDSFILKIVRNFPKELGLQNAVSVLDSYDENRAVDDAVKLAMARTVGSGSDVADAFRQACVDEYPRQCIVKIGGILSGQGWREFVISHPASVGWTVEGMCESLGVPLESQCPDLSMIPFNDIGRKNAVSPEEQFVRFARGFDGSTGPLETTDKVKELMTFFWENPDATVYEYSYYGARTLNCGVDGANAIRGAVRHMMNVYLKRQLEIVRAKIRLVVAVEREYERMTRRMGKLTFADFTKYSAEEEFSQRGIALRNVEYRFDSRFDHWALDEFQDTSEIQWRCLRELVQNAADDGKIDSGRTAMVVGDMKQSIYAWRGASAQPFDDVAGWPSFAGFERDFSVSHRYGPNIAAFVNAVFGLGNIRSGGIIPDECSAAIESWRSGWRDHVSNEPSDHVRVVMAETSADDEDDPVMAKLLDEIKSLWTIHGDVHSQDTVGILVRDNTHGRTLAEYLRKHGLDVVWEGMNPCSDDPVVQAVLSLLKLAEHPSDSAAWMTVSELIDIRGVLLPSCEDVAAASKAVADTLTRNGLARTLKDWCGALRSSQRIATNGLTAEKLCRLVELGVEFESRPNADDDASAFAEFVEKSGRREVSASPDVIRILTIHRSKGLGIDHVFVPLFEGERYRSAIDAPSGRSPLFDGGDWVLSHLQKGSERFNGRTSAAYRRQRSACFGEALRTYYVALTRAKKSMVVVLPPEDGRSDPSSGLLMRDVILQAIGTELPYEAGELPSLAPKSGATPTEGRLPWPPAGKRQIVLRETPSHIGAAFGGANVAAVDAFNAGFGASARKGIDVHAAYARIEWIDPSAPRDDLEAEILASSLREAFVKPTADATVWRERGYETFDGRVWSSGQFDRVVFTGEGADRRATIYDFKTNRPQDGEDDDAFAERMLTTYAPQLESYRNALSRMTALPKSRIAAALLLRHTGRVVAVGAVEVNMLYSTH